MLSILVRLEWTRAAPSPPISLVRTIDRLESFILETTGNGLGCLLHGSRVPILFFADDNDLLSHFVEDLQNLVHPLDSFNDRQELAMNLSKTKVMVLNTLKATLDQTQITFQSDIIHTTSSYTYLGALFLGPRFSMRIVAPPRVSWSYATVSTLERQCF